MIHTYNPSVKEANTGRFLQDRDQPVLYSETLAPKKKLESIFEVFSLPLD